MNKYPTNPNEIINSLWKNRRLIKAATRREILGRYKGSLLGLMWSFFYPVFMLVVYSFVFSNILKVKWNVGDGSKVEFGLVLFSGLIVYNFFSECIVNAPRLIVANVNYVKKVLYPIEILTVVSVLSGLFHFTISLIVFVFAYFIFIGTPPLAIAYTPIILFPFIMILGGLSWSLAATSVYVRDIEQFIGILSMILMFMSPILYPISSIPENYRAWLYFNPLTLEVEEIRKLLFLNEAPDFVAIGLYWVVGFLILWLGFAWFQKTREGFADVL